MLLLLMSQLILLMLLLIINGEPLRFFVFRRFKLFSDLDLIQICILDIYLGGLILYIIAMIPFPLFTWITFFLLTATCLICTVFIHYKSLILFADFSKLKTYLIEKKEAIFDYEVVFAMFFIFLFLNLFSLSNLVFGSVHDESMHSLLVKVILENNRVPVTVEPYLSEGIVYPLASHVIFAYASLMLNMEVPKAIFYGTILFKALSIFGAYSLGKKISSNRFYYLGLSFIFAFISSWPLYVAWGGNPFLVGFPLFLVSLGILFSLVYFSKESTFTELVAVGLLFGYSSVLVISFLQNLAITAVLFISWLILKYRYSRDVLLKFAIIFLVSLIPLSPFLYRFIDFYRYPGHNLGVASDFSAYPQPQFHVIQALLWAFENLSPYVSLRAITFLFLIGLGVLLLLKLKDYKKVEAVVAFALAIFAAAVLLSLVSFFLPPSFGVISWGHQGIILVVPICILIVVFYIKLVDFCREYEFEVSPRFFSKNSYSNMFLAVTLFSLITAPFIYYRFAVDPQTLRGSYEMFAITTKDDYDLMNWMKENLSSNTVILVNPNEAGLFIPSVSCRKIIFPYSGSSLSHSYQTLVGLLDKNTLNTTTYVLMQHWNISHVFIGSNSIYWLGNPKWNPKLFLGNPNFNLVKNFGDAYLFKRNYTNANANVAFLDDFEYELWNQNKWQTNFAGNGLGNVTITAGLGYNSSNCLKITAAAVPTAIEWKYARWVSREIFVLNNSHVTLSFYFNTTKGFAGNDTFAVLISNVYHNQTVIITNPNGVYENYKHVIQLNMFEGFSEKYDLSATWQRMFNSSLPNPFILEFANWDFDGIENVVCIDSVTVTSTPVN